METFNFTFTKKQIVLGIVFTLVAIIISQTVFLWKIYTQVQKQDENWAVLQKEFPQAVISVLIEAQKQSQAKEEDTSVSD